MTSYKLKENPPKISPKNHPNRHPKLRSPQQNPQQKNLTMKKIYIL
jgi:hypothetical protein